jgi:hypothetical protein
VCSEEDPDWHCDTRPVAADAVSKLITEVRIMSNMRRASNKSRESFVNGFYAVGGDSSELSNLLRDIFGNPFRPVTFPPEWRIDTVLTLAQQMYDGRDFSAMPILADALQDAGCDSDDILNHCRGDGPHVRGCWVVDLVLGKA